MADLKDLVKFLAKDSRIDVKSFALDYVVGLTGSPEGRSVFLTEPNLVDALIDVTRDPHEPFARDAFRGIVNTSAECLLERHCQVDFVNELVTGVTEEGFKFAEEASMILANLSRDEKGAKSCFRAIREGDRLSRLIDVFCKDSVRH